MALDFDGDDSMLFVDLADDGSPLLQLTREE